MEPEMNLKRIFVLNGHPAKTSLNKTLAETYAASAKEAGHEVRLVHLNDLQFDVDAEFGGYETTKPLEPDLEKVLNDLEWSDHIVITTPMWWGGVPAKLKGLMDRALLPGRTFSTRETTWMGLPTPLLSGRTGRVFITSDTPNWFYHCVYKNALVHQIKKQILGHVGIKPAKFTHFSGASHPKTGKVESWISRVASYGLAGA